MTAAHGTVGQKISPPEASSKPTYSWHATGRMESFGISQEEVSDTVRYPLATWPGRTTVRGRTRHYLGRRILVLVGVDSMVVITVKLRTFAPYTHGVHTLANLPNEASALSPSVGGLGSGQSGTTQEGESNPRPCLALTSPATNAATAPGSSCSQTRMTSHPASARRVSVSRSRA